MDAIQIQSIAERLAQIQISTTRGFGAKAYPGGAVHSPQSRPSRFAGILEATLSATSVTGPQAIGTRKPQIPHLPIAALAADGAGEKGIEDSQVEDTSTMNLLQYAVWRMADSGTSAEDRRILEATLGALVMQFVGYAPRGYTNEQVVNWFLAQMHS